MDFGKEGPQKRNMIYGVTAVLILAAASCGTQKKLTAIRDDASAPSLSLPREASALPEIADRAALRDTLKVVGDDGNEVYIMKAVKDEDGEMVATDVLDAAVVSARFRNVAERCGEVDLKFEIGIPASMRDSRWQMRLTPYLSVLGDSLALEPLVITGEAYRKAQLRGYQQYERFLSRIVSDTASFVNVRELELFLRRNIPQIYAFKTDSSFVSDEQFESFYGISQAEALDHYTDKIALGINRWRKSRVDLVYRRKVRSPIVVDGIRLDTIVAGGDGIFVYNYTQTIRTRPGLRKAGITLSGGIYEQDRELYGIPPGPPLTFYISSLSSFADGTERFLTKVIERRAEANTACYVSFLSGKSEVDETLPGNADEIGRIKGNLRELMSNRTYDLDSILVVSSASPEGSLGANERLCRERSASISRYLSAFLEDVADSIGRDEGLFVDENGEVAAASGAPSVPFVSRSGSENWLMLDRLVERDTVLDAAAKEAYALSRSIPDPDRRELAMRREPWYRYMRESLYPRLRVVSFDFHLHRKGMVKDTVHTTVPDTVYAEGVRALRDMDYPKALSLLAPYRDFNAALCCLSMGRDNNARAILETLPETDRTSYLLAVLYCREGNLEEAARQYRKACLLNPSYVHRGNLDPEISALKRLYPGIEGGGEQTIF